MTDITAEIVAADVALQEAETRVTEASRILRNYRRDRMVARSELSRLIKELRTGESRYPLLERIATNGETATPGPPPGPGPSSEADLDVGTAAIAAITETYVRWNAGPWSEADLDAAIVGACDLPHGGHWNHLLDVGCDDQVILEVLRAIWPAEPTFSSSLNCTCRGGCEPALWMGRAARDRAPDLTGLALADRVRRQLGIPRAPEPVPAPPDEVVEPTPKKPRRKRGS